MREEIEVTRYVELFLTSGSVYFDIGACEGDYSIEPALRGVKVFAFEPEELNFNSLVKKVKRITSKRSVSRHTESRRPPKKIPRKKDQINSKNNIKCFKVALLDGSRKQVRMRITASELHPGGHHRTVVTKYFTGDPSIRPEDKKFVYVKVESSSLDKFIKNNNIRTPNHMKVDVDGSEYLFFKGAKNVLANKQLNDMMVELYTEGKYYDEILNKIEKAGFVEISRHKIENNLFNILFVRKESKSSKVVEKWKELWPEHRAHSEDYDEVANWWRDHRAHRVAHLNESDFMSDTTLYAYKENGFAIFRGVIDEKIIDCVLIEISAVVKRKLDNLSLPYNKDSMFDNFKKIFNHDNDSYYSLVRAVSKLLCLNNVLTSEIVKKAVYSLGLEQLSIPTTPIIHSISEELISTGGYFGLKPHQDWPSVQGSLDSVVVWLPLVSIEEINYPLQIIPRSHKLGILEGTIGKNETTIDEKYFNSNNFKSVRVQPGDLVIMSQFAIHRTKIDACKGFRMAASIRYDNMLENKFIERNFPCAYKRIVDRELITNNFPKEADIQKVFEVKK